MNKTEFLKAKTAHENGVLRKTHTHGYPVNLVSSFIARCEFLEAEKNKWKAVAKTRGGRLEKIRDLAQPVKCELEEECS